MSRLRPGPVVVADLAVLGGESRLEQRAYQSGRIGQRRGQAHGALEPGITRSPALAGADEVRDERPQHWERLRARLEHGSHPRADVVVRGDGIELEAVRLR